MADRDDLARHGLLDDDGDEIDRRRRVRAAKGVAGIANDLGVPKGVGRRAPTDPTAAPKNSSVAAIKRR
jgi:hypothetical protein